MLEGVVLLQRGRVGRGDTLPSEMSLAFSRKAVDPQPPSTHQDIRVLIKAPIGEVTGCRQLGQVLHNEASRWRIERPLQLERAQAAILTDGHKQGVLRPIDLRW